MRLKSETLSLCYLATGNTHKVEEFKRLARELNIPLDFRSADEIGGMPKVEETGTTFSENANLKAEGLAATVAGKPGAFILADDSGLAVDALDGRPGIYSARYAGPEAGDGENVAKLLQEMKSIPEGKRSGRFICALTLLASGGKSISVAGSCEGKIAAEPQGEAGFGYDPVFIPEGYEQSLAALGPEVKDQLSHRRKALELLKNKIGATSL